MSQKIEFYCCETLHVRIEDESTPFKYSSKLQEYFIVDRPFAYFKKSKKYMTYPIQYCPSCGKKFPQSLASK